MVMTKNPLALGGGALIMLFGISLAGFFGYNFFLEQKVYRSSHESVMGIVTKKEKQEIFADALSNDHNKHDKTAPKNADHPETTPAQHTGTTSTANTSAAATTTSTSAASSKSAPATKTTTPAEPPVRTNYKLYYAFTPANATTPVTGVLKATKRLFEAMNENDKVEVLYSKENPKDDHRALFPYKFGQSFYLGVGALMGGAFFVTYLGWCFIFPED